MRETVVVHSTYVEAVAVTFVPVAAEAPPELNWRRIGQGAVLGALCGAAASLTAGDLNSTVSLVAGVVNVAVGFAILGALWGAVFFSPEHGE